MVLFAQELKGHTAPRTEAGTPVDVTTRLRALTPRHPKNVGPLLAQSSRIVYQNRQHDPAFLLSNEWWRA